MTSALAPLMLALSVASTGGLFGHHPSGPPKPYVPHTHHPGGRILPPGPGDGWGFPNGNPDGYGWVDYGEFLPLNADRTPDYFARRYFFVPASQTFFPTYYNPYEMRGQRYIPFAGCGGAHPFGGPPLGPSNTPVYPYRETAGDTPAIPVPDFSGNVDAPPIPSGSSGMIP